MLMSLRSNLAGTLLPRLGAAVLTSPCVLCRDPAGREGWCTACWEDLPGRGLSRCPRCALPGPAAPACGRCLARPPAFERTYAGASYAFPLDAIVSQFKYGGNLRLAAPLAALLCAAARAAPRPDLVVPVPASAQRLLERGFNQAAELARIAAGALALALDPGALARRRADPPQASLPLAQRSSNVRGAFVCTRPLRGARVAVVDDVMTSGATLDELAQTLLRAGAAEVQCWVVARTPEPR